MNLLHYEITPVLEQVNVSVLVFVCDAVLPLKKVATTLAVAVFLEWELVLLVILQLVS